MVNIYHNLSGSHEFVISQTGTTTIYIFLDAFTTSELKVTVCCTVAGAYGDVRIIHIQKNSEQLMLETVQMHTVPHTGSSVVVKGLLQDAAQCVYRGIIHIAPGAENTQAFQKSHTLLMGERAAMHATPALEVLTNNVQCKHGSAIATLANSELEYLAARGITPDNAKKVLIESFFCAILDDNNAREFFMKSTL